MLKKACLYFFGFLYGVVIVIFCFVKFIFPYILIIAAVGFCIFIDIACGAPIFISAAATGFIVSQAIKPNF